MRIHITEKMIDAVFEAFKAEAKKDGHIYPDVKPDSPEMKRFRQVIRIGLEAAAKAMRPTP